MYKLAISRPVTTIMFAISLLFFGMTSLQRMPVALFPNVDLPFVTITTVYNGASAEIVETKATDKIEEAISGISGLKSINSTSAKNISVVVAEFELKKSIEEAVNDVRDKVGSVTLGTEVDKPAIEKFSTSAAPIISLFIKSSKAHEAELSRHVDESIKPILQRVKGVGSVRLVGYKERVIRITPQISSLNKNGITFSQLAQKINQENLKLDGGRIVEEQKEWLIASDAEAKSLDDIRNIQVLDGVLLKDIAEVNDGVKEERSYANYNGASGVILEVQKVSGANEIELADGVKERLEYIKSISPGYDIELFFDKTDYIKNSLESVLFDLALGMVLATLIVFLFLRNLSATIISFLTLPISIYGTIAIMAFLDQSLNLLTLTAMILAIGIIIDDAIVVIENIYSKIEDGMGKKEAALEGVQEIGFSIIAISAMLLAVFIPVATMGGIVGKFFTSFGLTVVGAVIISYIIAVTFIPMLSSLSARTEHSGFFRVTEPFFVTIESIYEKSLRFVLAHKLKVIAVVFGIFIFSMSIAGKLGMVFMPLEDKSEFQVLIKDKPGISVGEMKRKMLLLQERFAKEEGLEFSSLQIAGGSEEKAHQGYFYVRLSEPEARSRTQSEMMDEFRKIIQSSGTYEVSVSEIADVGGGDNNSPFQIIIKAKTTELAQESATKLVEYIKSIDGSKDVQTNLEAPTPELRLEILRENAARLGLKSQDIALLVANAFAGESAISYYKEAGKEYKIIMRVSDDERDSVQNIKKLTIKNEKGEEILLGSLLEIKESLSPSSIKRYDRQRQVTVFSQIDEGKLDLGTLLNSVESNKDKWLIDGVSYAIEGDAKNMVETADAFSVAMISAIVMIYLILASLYESPLQPLIIMVALPLSFTGAFLALYITGQSMSLFSMMGLMLLMGLVGKNATLIVDVANRLKGDGKRLDERLIEAGKSRLRPILMTTIAMIFGMLPLAFATGEGSAVKVPLGTTVIGGLLVSMMLSLLAVPAFYKLLNGIDEKIRKWYS